MTCIVGVVDGDHVIIGGDSAGVGGYSITSRADSKVFRVGEYVMGFTTSFRMGQLLRYSFDAPAPTGWDVDRHMATTFVTSVRTCLSNGGWLKTNSGRDDGGTFLVGIRGLLYAVYGDFQIARAMDGYASVGCGADLALGSLHSTRGGNRSARRRAELALEAAAHHSAGVCAPFAFETTKGDL